MKDFRKELLGGLAHIYGPTTSHTETKPVFLKSNTRKKQRLMLPDKQQQESNFQH